MACIMSSALQVGLSGRLVGRVESTSSTVKRTFLGSTSSSLEKDLFTLAPAASSTGVWPPPPPSAVGPPAGGGGGVPPPPPPPSSPGGGPLEAEPGPPRLLAGMLVVLAGWRVTYWSPGEWWSPGECEDVVDAGGTGCKVGRTSRGHSSADETLGLRNCSRVLE